MQLISKHAALGLVSVLAVATLVGCSSPNTYSPSAQPTQLSAYAASLKYPADTQAMDNPKLTAVVDGGNGQLTLHNYGDASVINFNLWLNQVYVLHVDSLAAGSYRVFNLTDFYNSAGNNDLASKNLQRVQVQTSDQKLMNVQGPQQM